MVEKAVNAKAKASFQSTSRTKEIDFKCPKDYKLAKKDKDKANHKHWDRNKNKFT